MSNEKDVSRRKFLKYVGAGAAVAVAAGAAGYFAGKPGPSPEVVTTVTEALTSAMPTSPAASALPMTTPNKRYKIVFSNGEMADPWRWSFVQDMENWSKKYQELGPGIDFIWTNALSDSAKQLSDVETLLAMAPDALILSPYESAPLDPAVDKCAEANVPLFCIDREVSRKPGTGTYVQAIIQDWYYSGRARAKLLADLLTQKNGAPKGNVVEIDGTLASSPCIQYSVGIEDYFAHMNNFKDIVILDSRPGDWDAGEAATIIEDDLSRFPKGQLDAIFSHGDIMSLPSLDACKRSGRDELMGYITGQDCYVPWLEKVQSGEGAFSVECPPYFGYAALESVIQYLNGAKVDQYKYIPLRNYTRWRPGDNEILQEQIAACQKLKIDYPTTEMDKYTELAVDVPNGKPSWWNEGDPVPSSNLKT
jgi:ABC-type sugar transport system substrate-binding protein